MSRIINNLNKKELRRDLRKKQTPEEILLWSKLRNNKMGYKWRRQVSIGNYVADFYCREKLLAVELDGMEHLRNKVYDQERSKFFELLGIKTLRFWNSELHKNLSLVVEKIVIELQSRIGTPSPFQEKG